MTHYNPDDATMIMLTMCNVTKCILFDQLKQHNEILSVINATTSHELRNPLNALIACNLEKEALYDRFEKIIQSDAPLSESEIAEIKDIMR